jgi:hypothetical protein
VTQRTDRQLGESALVALGLETAQQSGGPQGLLLVVRVEVARQLLDRGGPERADQTLPLGRVAPDIVVAQVPHRALEGQTELIPGERGVDQAPVEDVLTTQGRAGPTDGPRPADHRGQLLDRRRAQLGVVPADHQLVERRCFGLALGAGLDEQPPGRAPGVRVASGPPPEGGQGE